MLRIRKYIFTLLLLFLVPLACSGCASGSLLTPDSPEPSFSASSSAADSTGEYPAWDGQPYTAVSGNVPAFSSQDLTARSFESYSDLDTLGRCGPAFACIGQDLMPDTDREDISGVHPTGWHSVQYDFVDGKSLYNRCHLIGYQLTGENANEKNLITGTRYMNVEGMLPFENMVADYIHETGCHVLYRVTPVFRGDNLVADGVQMEAMSVEDRGASICFNVFVYNVQPGVSIDYATGESRPADSAAEEETGDITYILNTNTRRFHRLTCSGAAGIKESNRETSTKSRDALIEQGYIPCRICSP